MRILLIEDEAETAAFVSSGLRQAGHTVDVVENGQDGIALGIQDDFDLVIIDRKIPGPDGLLVARALRGSGKSVSILFLTALGSINDRVQGLDAGGDDYLVKPFAFSELLARVHALGRRVPARNEQAKLTVADLEMDVIHRVVTRNHQVITLLPREFMLLEILLRNKGRVVLRTMLLERVWGFRFDPKTSVIETYISRLRAKVDKPFETPLIHTVRGQGYSVYEP